MPCGLIHSFRPALHGVRRSATLFPEIDDAKSGDRRRFLRISVTPESGDRRRFAPASPRPAGLPDPLTTRAELLNHVLITSLRRRLWITRRRNLGPEGSALRAPALRPPWLRPTLTRGLAGASLRPQHPKGGFAAFWTSASPHRRRQETRPIRVPVRAVATLGAKLTREGGACGANPHLHGKPLPVSHPAPSARSFAEAGLPAGGFPDNGTRADAVAPVSQQRGRESGIHSETGPARRQRRPETSHFCATAGGKEGRREVRGCAKTVPAAPWRRFLRQASWPSESIP
jgi:hypothetical protein